MAWVRAVAALAPPSEIRVFTTTNECFSKAFDRMFVVPPEGAGRGVRRNASAIPNDAVHTGTIDN